MYDYGWRSYMPDVGRWIQVDPLFNDLDTSIDFDQEDENDDEIDMSIAFARKMEVGGGVFNTDNLNPYSYGYNNPAVYDDPDGKCPACLLVWGAVELGLAVYDAYDAYSTLTDKNASTTDKAIVVGGVAASALLPGGGYGTAGKTTAKVVDKTLDAKKVVSKADNVAKNLTPQKAKNLEKAAEKGIPSSQLGPSGKPKVHTVSKSNNKQAKDAARNNPKSNTQPVKHSSDKGQKTHYHSIKKGEKLGGKDNVHYEDRSTKRNPR